MGMPDAGESMGARVWKLFSAMAGCRPPPPWADRTERPGCAGRRKVGRNSSAQHYSVLEM